MNPDSSHSVVIDSVHVDAEWDAGDLACGDLVLELLNRMRALSPKAVLKLTATDPAARIDIGAWCRVTKNRLVAMSPPVFFIERKES
jgi:tRNA 2-thiouridine synthesizing protein A